MKLLKVKLHNYRSFAEEQVIYIDELTTIIGNNSAGKTAALSALNLIFSHVSSERILRRSDFHVPNNMKPEDFDKQELYVEAVFSFDEILSDDKEKDYYIPIFYQKMVVPNLEAGPILRIRLEATWERSSNAEGSIESKICYITCPEDKEIKENHKIAASRKDLDYIRVIYVPAVRDPSKQLKNVSGTMINQILSSVVWHEDTKKDVQYTIEKLNFLFKSETGVSVLDQSICDQWKMYDPDARYSKAELRFNSTDIDSSIKNSEVYFSPTVTEKEYTIDEMGDGLRSLFYISLVNSILDVENEMTREYEDESINENERTFSTLPPILTIVAIEEPENHISPQLLGKLLENLRNISSKSNAQVIITSHSPAIVKRIEPENLRYFRMNQDTMSTIVKEILLPDNEKFENQYKYIKEAVRSFPELYFSRIVVLGEGDSEEIILPKFFEAYGKKLDSYGISVVPLSGRYVNHFWRLLTNLGIPYITLLDLDREREGGGWGRIKYAVKQLILNGVPREKLLTLDNGCVLTDEELENMHTWNVSAVDSMRTWMDCLETFNVFFSEPLDIDFMMLEYFRDKYLDTIDDNEGPQLIVKVDEGTKRIKVLDEEARNYTEELKRHIESDINRTLKKEGGDGSTYNEKQKELMLWYNYFFLNRGKPTTHISVLSGLTNEELLENTPVVIKKIIESMNSFL